MRFYDLVWFVVIKINLSLNFKDIADPEMKNLSSFIHPHITTFFLRWITKDFGPCRYQDILFLYCAEKRKFGMT